MPAALQRPSGAGRGARPKESLGKTVAFHATPGKLPLAILATLPASSGARVVITCFYLLSTRSDDWILAVLESRPERCGPKQLVQAGPAGRLLSS